MRVHYLQHVPFEGLGSIGPWLEAAGHKVTSTRLYEGVRLPEPDDFDLLIILGGPMSVNDVERFPWLRAEKLFIRRVVELKKRVLGICLGAQLIAASLGKAVYPNRYREIGWFPVHSIAGEGPTLFHFPSRLEVLHWHGETFDLPEGAQLLASSEACRNQAFQLSDRVIGLQFHLESTPEWLSSLIDHCADDLTPARYVQTKATLLSEDPQKFRTINDEMAKILSTLCACP